MLGSIVSWTFKSEDYPISSIRDALAYAGLPESSIESLDMRRAFGRAARKIAHGEQVDKVPGESDVVSFQFSRRSFVDNGKGTEVEYGYLSRVTLNIATGELKSDDAEVQEQARAALIACTESRTAGDLNKAVKRLIESNGELYAINPEKGVAYFVPAKHADYALKVELFVKSLSGGRWYVFAVPDNDSRTNESICEAVEHGLKEEVAALAKAVDQFDDSTREGTLTKYVEHYQKTAHKVEGYAEFLSGKAAELLKKLSEEKEILTAKILKREEESTVAT